MRKKKKGFVKKLTMSKAVWNKLQATYQQKDIATQVIAQKKFPQLAMIEDTSIIKFIKEFQWLLKKILIFRLDICEEQQHLHLLEALPPSWWPFVSSWGANLNWTFSYLIARNLEESTMRTFDNSK
jgi:hypothetical protein